MTVRGRVQELRRFVSGAELLRRKPQLLRAAGCGLNLLLGFAMSAARILGGCGPFGIGMVARAGCGLGGVMCLIGACMGYLLTGGFDWGIRYVATAVLVFTAAFVFQDLKISKTEWFMPAVTAAITLVTGFLNTFELLSPIPMGVSLFTEVVLAGGSAYFFGIALSEQKWETESAELRHGVSLVIFVACLLMSVSGIEIMGVISIGRLLAVLLVLTAAYKGGATAGSAAGAAMGLAMDMVSGETPFFTMAYAFAALLSGVFSKHGRLTFVLSFVLSNAVAVIWTWGAEMRLEALYEAFAASVVFMILPASVLNYAGAVLQQVPAGSGESGLRRYTAGRVQRLSEAFRDLYETVRRNAGADTNVGDVASVFDHAADAVCISCKHRDECWTRDYMDTLTVMNDATKAMMERGRLVRSDLAPRFLDRCERSDSFISAVNAELRSLMFRRQFRSRLEENRTAAYGQYADVAEILDGLSQELSGAAGPDPLAERRMTRFLRAMDIDADVSVFRDRSGRLRAVIESNRLNALLKEADYMDKLSSVLGVRLCRPTTGAEAMSQGRLTLLEAEPLAVSVGIAAMKKKGERVSGDRGTYFKTDSGMLCVILSDGMGSGEGAAKESIGAVRILERFLRSGVEPATAMKILNSVMLLKNGEEWGYATVDLMCIDLFSGKACFYKYGAAPSYIKSGKTIRRVRGDSLAAGICAGENAMPDIVRMRFKPGSTAVIASDGVLAERDDKWLRELLGNFEGGDTKTLAKSALQGAVKHCGCTDDMTVLAVQVTARS